MAFDINLKNQIAKFIKLRFYENQTFWNKDQYRVGFVKEWTEEQVNYIFYKIMTKFFSQKPIQKWGKQVINRIISTIKAIPLILDGSPEHPSKAEIARKSGFSEYSSAIDGLVTLLRPNNYQSHFSWDNIRNPAKKNRS